MKRYNRGITFGAFDPLHYGHIRLFENAKAYCNELIVCVSTPRYIIENKGRRERVPLEDRCRAVTAIKHVDIVELQDVLCDKKDLVAEYQPDVIFVGDDWNPDTFKGEGLGVPVVYLPHTEGMSSTQLTEKKT